MKELNIIGLNFKYKDELFNDLNLSIKLNTINMLIGPNGSGKTTLGKIISGQIKTKNIYFDETLIDPTKYIIYLDKNIKNTPIKRNNILTSLSAFKISL